MKNKAFRLIAVLFFIIFGALGAYFWGVTIKSRQAYLTRVLDSARAIRPAAELSTKKIKTIPLEIDFSEILSDFTIDNNLKASILKLITQTTTFDANKLKIYSAQNDIKAGAGLSGNQLFFITTRHGSIKLVIKTFLDPFADNSSFIREISGFQVASTLTPKSYQLITLEAAGLCTIHQKQYGLLALSPSRGSSLRDLMIQILYLPQGSQKRAKKVTLLQRALERLGTAFAELHKTRAQKNSTIHPSILEQANKYLHRTLELLNKKTRDINTKQLIATFNTLYTQVQSRATTRSLTHGDAHLGNFMYDFETAMLSMIDLSGMSRAADQDSSPISNAALDTLSIIDDLKINTRWGLLDQEYAALRDSFLHGYTHNGGILPTSVEKKFFELVDRLRIISYFLKLEHDKPEQIDEIKKEIINFRLDLIKRAVEIE